MQDAASERQKGGILGIFAEKDEQHPLDHAAQSGGKGTETL